MRKHPMVTSMQQTNNARLRSIILAKIKAKKLLKNSPIAIASYRI